MFGKRGLLVAVLVGTAVVPYLMSSSTGLVNLAARVWPPTADDAATANGADADGAAAGTQRPTGAARPGAVPTRPLEDVLRFDVTTAWVLANWPRVSAGLAELDLQGYRVPLVTGTQEVDVAGSLTYYFNSQQRVERITLFGSTGDAGKLVALLESRFGFQRMVVPEPNQFVYQVKSFGKVKSELRMRPVPVVRKDVPYARFEVALLLERPK